MSIERKITEYLQSKTSCTRIPAKEYIRGHLRPRCENDKCKNNVISYYDQKFTHNANECLDSFPKQSNRK